MASPRSPTAANLKEWLEIKLKNYNQQQDTIAMICWALWKNRNELVWNNKCYTVDKVIATAKNLLQQWREANKPQNLPMTILENVKWKPPSTGSLKLNIDAVIFDDQRKAGLDLVIRDDMGSFVAARTVPVQGIVNPLIAEVLGVCEALSWIKNRFPDVRTVEMDALLVYKALQNNEVHNSYFGTLIEECRLLAKDVPNLHFNWVRRSANQAAHTLAKAASSHNSVNWSYFPPLFISSVLLTDLINE